MNIPKYKIESKELGSEHTKEISAFSAEKAWDKFITQYFGALKPDRSDWRVSRIK